mmetsp:Transcript_12095/g.28918  ORF Transcript_12095/g.28918 Transcript_12095/m.28918 type:complete len:101 (+) Transcript_12095:215-517(+)
MLSKVNSLLMRVEGMQVLQARLLKRKLIRSDVVVVLYRTKAESRCRRSQEHEGFKKSVDSQAFIDEPREALGVSRMPLAKVEKAFSANKRAERRRRSRSR